MRFRILCSAVAVSFLAGTPHALAQSVSVSVTPNCRVMEANGGQTFTAAVAGSGDQNVVWMVNGVPGGAPSIGTITPAGFYRAPANADAAVNVRVSAVAVADARQLANVNVCVNQYVKTGNTYYVAKTGSDTNAGTSSAPWLTIQHAVDTVSAGDTILVRSGVYNEQIDVTKSGSSANGYITLMEAAGETAIIDGTGMPTPADSMKGLITLFNVDYWRVKGFEIRNYKSTNSFIPVGVFVAQYGNRIEIRDNIIHDIGANFANAGATQANGLGIAVYGQVSTVLRNVIIDGNELYNLQTGHSESLTVGANVQYFQITNNVVHDNNFIGIDVTGYYGGDGTYRARNGWVSGNTVYNLSSTGNLAINGATAIGIYVDGGTDIVIERNNVYSNESGIWAMSEKSGKFTSNTTIRNNIVRDHKGTGIMVGAYDSAAGGAENITVANNTFYKNSTGTQAKVPYGEFSINQNVDGLRFYNNAFVSGANKYTISRPSAPSSSNIAIGNNLYWNQSGASSTWWYWSGTSYYNNGATGEDFVAFQSASGDTNSVVGHPRFTDSNNADFHLNSNSAALNIGLFSASFGIPSVGEIDFGGSPRVVGNSIDAGAYERQ